MLRKSVNSEIREALALADASGDFDGGRQLPDQPQGASPG